MNRALASGVGVIVLAVASLAVAKPAMRADKIVIQKSTRELTLFYEGVAVKTYRVALGHSPTGAKQCKCDNKTPEGRYRIDSKNFNSHFHRSLSIDYPHDTDKANAKKVNCEPGGDIMIHGIKNGLRWLGPIHRARDWTTGCIAVTDGEIEEIYAAVPIGTIVEINP